MQAFSSKADSVEFSELIIIIEYFRLVSSIRLVFPSIYANIVNSSLICDVTNLIFSTTNFSIKSLFSNPIQINEGSCMNEPLQMQLQNFAISGRMALFFGIY